MSHHRLELLVSHVSFASNSNPAVGDGWCEVEGFVSALNSHRHAFLMPSEKICVGESISRWYGPGEDWSEIGLPH